MLGAGVALRVWLMADWRPAFLGFPDTAGFLIASQGDFAGVNLRPPGYPVALAAIRALVDSAGFVAGVQHALGLVAAVALWLACRRLGLPAPACIGAAAAIALNTTVIALEHALLAESLFLVLVCLGLLACASAAEPGRRRAWAWAAGAGALFGAAFAFRTVGLPLALLAAAFVASSRPRRPRALAALALVAAAAAPIGANLAAVHARSGTWSSAINDAYQAYGRVAPFADCRAFRVPPGTEKYCPPLDVRQRPGASWWLYAPESPLLRVVPHPSEGRPGPEELARMRAFTLAAIIGQPRTYSARVLRDVRRIVQPAYPANPHFPDNQGAGYQPDSLIEQLRSEGGQALSAQWDELARVEVARGTSFLAFERAVRIDGGVLGLILVLALGAPLVVGRRARRGTLLLWATGFALLIVPILTLSYNWRYVVPAVPILVPVALAGGQAAFERLRDARRSRRGLMAVAVSPD